MVVAVEFKAAIIRLGGIAKQRIINFVAGDFTELKGA